MIFSLRWHEWRTDALVRDHLKDDSMPYLGDLIKSTSMMFVNSHYSLNGPKPNSPAVVELGGIHTEAKLGVLDAVSD